MGMDKTTHHIGRSSVQVGLTVLAIMFGLTALVLAVLTEADGPAPRQQAVAAPTEFSMAIDAADSSLIQNERLSTAEHASSAPSDKLSKRLDEPRECRPDQGIVDDCTFD